MSIHTISSPEIPFFRLVQSVWQIIISLSTGPREIPRTPKRRVRVVGIRQPFDRSLRTHGTDTVAAPSDSGGLVNDTSFVEVPVGLDAVWDLEIAGVAAGFCGGALRRVYTIEVVSFCVGFADTVGEAIWELWRQCWKWSGAGIVGFGDHSGGRGDSRGRHSYDRRR